MIHELQLYTITSVNLNVLSYVLAVIVVKERTDRQKSCEERFQVVVGEEPRQETEVRKEHKGRTRPMASVQRS